MERRRTKLKITQLFGMLILSVISIFVLMSISIGPSQTRVCLAADFLRSHSGQVTVILLDTGASVVSAPLMEPPDLSGVTEEHDPEFKKRLASLSPEVIYTNIGQLLGSAEQTLAEVGGKGRTYAQEHMRMYVKDSRGDWFEVFPPVYC